MMMDFMDGIKAVLQAQKLTGNIQLLAENIGLGGSEKEVYEKAEKLLVLEGIDLLVAYIDLRVMELLKPLLYVSGKLVLIVNPGANYPKNWAPQPNILYLGLQHSFLCWLTGAMAANMGKKRAAVATTFYDCGYLHIAAIVNAFTEGGGSISHHYVNNQKNDEPFQITALTEFLAADADTDCLLCVSDTQPASHFYELLNNSESARKIDLFVSPMMLEKKALETAAGGFHFNVQGYLPWHESIEDSYNQVFQDLYLRHTKRKPSVFALLGWETGLLLEQVFLQSNGENMDGATLATELGKIIINSPRGEIKLDNETHYFLAPVYRASQHKSEGELVIEHAGYAAKEWTTFVEHPQGGTSSGWTNTYLCY